jgi:hypothetical protein
MTRPEQISNDIIKLMNEAEQETLDAWKQQLGAGRPHYAMVVPNRTRIALWRPGRLSLLGFAPSHPGRRLVVISGDHFPRPMPEFLIAACWLATGFSKVIGALTKYCHPASRSWRLSSN